MHAIGSHIRSWNSTGKIGRIGRHLAETPDVEVKLEFHREDLTHRAETHRHFNIRVFGPMPPDASDFPGGIPADVFGPDAARCVRFPHSSFRSCAARFVLEVINFDRYDLVGRISRNSAGPRGGYRQWRAEGGQGGPWPPGASLGGGAGPACRGEF